jgi:hypothetical protein
LPEAPRRDYLLDEDYSQEGAYQRAFNEVSYESAQDYYADYPAAPGAPVNPREASAILRYRRANANKLILSRMPETLERYPSLVTALAGTELTEDDARRLVNLTEMDSAFNAMTSTSDPIRQRNIILSMNPVQRSAFFDFFTAKVEELQREAAQNPSWAEQGWNAFYENVVDPVFNALIWANEKSQQAFRAGYMAVSEASDQGVGSVALYAIPGFGTIKAVTDGVSYWDDVAPGVYDQEYLNSLRSEYGAENVNTLLRLEELKRDGEPDPYGRWISEYVGTPMEDLVRGVTWDKYQDPEMLQLARLINTADQGNTGMLVLSPFPESWRENSAYDVAAGTLNVVGTVVLDPTLVGAKAVTAYRSARYSLMKLSNAGGIDDAFRMRRTRVFFDSLGKDMERLTNLTPQKAAVARDVMRRQYGNYLPPQVIDDMAESGVRNADDANKWFVSKYVAESILSGIGVGDKFGTTFEQIYRATNLAKRQPLLPGKTTAGVMRSRFRMLAAIHNPVNRRFADRLTQRFDETGEFVPGGFVDASRFGATLADEADSIGAEAGAIPRRGALGDFGRAAAGSRPDQALDKPTLLNRAGAALGYRYADKSVEARLDRISRRFAKAPMPTAVYMNDGRDAGLIYDWARVFLSRQDAAMVSDTWRKAGSQAVRKQIFNGLVKTHAAAKGVTLRDPSKSWRDFLPEVSRGGVYSPTLTMRRREDGVLVWDRSSPADDALSVRVDGDIATLTGQGDGLKPVIEFPAPASDDVQRLAENMMVDYEMSSAIVADVAKPYIRELTDTGTANRFGASDIADEITKLDITGKVSAYITRQANEGDEWYADLVLRLGGSTKSPRMPGIVWYTLDNQSEELAVFSQTVSREMVRQWYLRSQETLAQRGWPEVIQVWRTGSDETNKGLVSVTGRLQPVGTLKGEAKAYLVPRDRVLLDSYAMQVQAKPDLAKTTLQAVEQELLVRWDDLTPIRTDTVIQVEGRLGNIAAAEQAFGRYEPVIESVARFDDVVSIRPSNFNGQEYPLHLWQTADYVKVPNFVDIEQAGVKATFLGAMFGVTQGKVAQRIVDGWSLFNLAGPRYYLRNAFEDYVFYAMTQGVWKNVYKGRRFGTAMRRVRGTELGMVNRALQGKAVAIDDPDFSTKWSLIKSRFTEEDRAAAVQAMKDGDLGKMRDLVSLAMARTKLNGWSKADQDDLLDFVSEHGAQLLDEVNETAMYGTSALFPTVQRQSYMVMMDPADGVSGARLVRPSRQWGDVSPNGDNPLRMTAWLRDLKGLSSDGPIAQAALKGIYFGKTDDQLIPEIAAVIRSDKTMKYTDRLAAFHTAGATPEDFASRYVSDVRNMVSRPDGTPNDSLLAAMRSLDDGAVGPDLVMRADNLSVNDLIELVDVRDRPQFVLGQMVDEVPTANSIKSFDKIWAWMGEQYARVSREPIFIANYLEQRKLLRPYQQEMARLFGKDAARVKASRMATDRAYELTLSYTDNPRNRTLLAWNTRNVARYYRATEDFARRALRVGKNYPQGFWKIGLTYDALEDTGFVFSDENGEKYFVFPGTEMTINAVNWAIQRLPQFQDEGVLQMDSASYEFRGYVRMLAPSADPQQWLPTLSSPISAIGVKSLMNAFPAFNSLEQAILGEYAEGADFWKSILPSHANRMLALMDKDERYSTYSSAFKDAVQVSAAAGAMPAPDAPQEEWDNYSQGLSTLVTTLLVTRATLGFFLPAAPRLTANDVSDFAREGGVLNMDSAFREMIRVAQSEGSQNPFADGLVKYVETFGLDAVPYSLSTSESNDRFGSLAGLSSVAATEEGEKWVKEHSDLVSGKYKTASAWLMPRMGKYSADQARWLRDAGFKIPASYSETFEKARIAEGRYVLLSNRERAEADIQAARARYYEAQVSGSAAGAEEAWDVVRKLEDDWSAVQKQIKADYKGLEAFGTTTETIELNNESRKRLLDIEVRPMLAYIFNDRDRPVPPGAQNMADAIATLDLYSAELAKITGTTTAEDTDKRMLRTEAEILLNQIGERDPNTKFFVDVILLPILSRTYTPPLGGN